MRIPVMRGVIDRRILVNYRVDPDVMARVLPPPFRPKLVRGHAIGGICLIRLIHVRPRGLPAVLGIGSENAAHRIAVEWEDDAQACQGVYIPRRDTDSRLNALVGGRLFPGVHHRANFTVRESPPDYFVALQSVDSSTHMKVEARIVPELPGNSIFASLQEASHFFEEGSLGYSATGDPGRYDGLQLRCREWSVLPLEVSDVASSFFDDPQQFPPGSARFDSALLMRKIEHEWVGQETICCEPVGRAVPAVSEV